MAETAQELLIDEEYAELLRRMVQVYGPLLDYRQAFGERELKAPNTTIYVSGAPLSVPPLGSPLRCASPLFYRVTKLSRDPYRWEMPAHIGAEDGGDLALRRRGFHGFFLLDPRLFQRSDPSFVDGNVFEWMSPGVFLQ